MILELENICKEYMQGKIPVPVLKNINFSMEEVIPSEETRQAAPSIALCVMRTSFT